jgi:putative ABC transport system substrate-binding protein
MRRRAFCGVLATAPLAAVALAQPARPARIAWVSPDRGNRPAPYLDAFLSGMRDLGYVEKRDIVIEPWWGDGSLERVEQSVSDIVASQPHVIVAGAGTVSAFVRAGVKIPVVFTFSGDPVEGKVVQSFARPGGNMTGISLFALDLLGKRVELLKEMLPAVRRLAIIANPQHPGEFKELDAAKAAATAFAITPHYLPVQSEGELEAAFKSIVAARDEAILAFADGFTMGFAARIAAFSIETRIPAIGGWAFFAQQGNLMTYGPVVQDIYRRLAAYVDRILKGARPADLPVELPAKVELVINLKTANALGLAIPQTLIARADQVIQ